MHAEKRSADLCPDQEEQKQMKGWKIERNDTLPGEAVQIREEVFVREQDIGQPEMFF